LLSLTFDSQAALAEDPAQSAIYELVLHLDVPQVERAEVPFERMCQAAQGMAQTMDGIVTDDNDQALPYQALDTISQELQRLYDRLEQRDFAAGSALARRLFS
jgi:FtsZ-interacting cell division protein ZipA